MIKIFFKKDFFDNLKSYLVSLSVLLLLFISLYLSATLLPRNSNLILSPLYTMFVNLLPLVFIINTGNNLIVNKVDNGSFYLDLVCSYKRRDIIITKIIYFISSIFSFYFFLTIVGLICVAIKPISLTYENIIYLNFISFLLNLSLSSIVFFCSSIFNTSKYSKLIGGGIAIVSYVFKTISGMFDNIPGLEDQTLIKILKNLKYVSFHSLFSFDDILNNTSFNIISIIVFLSISVLLYTLSVIIFDNKDLPL